MLTFAALALLAVLPRLHSDTLYDITFDQMPIGMVYSNAAGPPNDFSGYGSFYGYPSRAVVAQESLGLSNVVLVSEITNSLARLEYLMDVQSATQHLLQLTMNISFGNGPEARVSFESEISIPSQTVVHILFDRDNVLQISSRHGPIYLPITDYSTNGAYVRNKPLRLQFEANTYTRKYSISLDDQQLVHDAPFHDLQPMTKLIIATGNCLNYGNEGLLAIDDIRVTADIAPELKPTVTSISMLEEGLMLTLMNPVISLPIQIQRSQAISGDWIVATNLFTDSTNWIDSEVTTTNLGFYRVVR